ncbi:hypothetical protein [uncultured Bacteroides sp.]|uniref:hypothetical protein n=1 Tax=uncultured Bacteroides sp. TaxID=162156 RepID=UPI002AAB5243|nr:hypothetical protein [uncultured Bacteroides sp.]
MKQYFLIQLKRSTRFFSDNGLNPILGTIFAPLLFILISLAVISLNYGVYFYSGITLFITTELSEINRNEFLKNCFSRSSYIKIRILENILIILPFCFVLTYKGYYLIASILTIASILMSNINFNKINGFVLPTPFYKEPFEFAVGFRKTFIFFLFPYFLAYKAYEVDNFNLIYASYISILIIVITYYNDIEDAFFVWIFNMSARKFLLMKLLTASKYTIMLCMPILLFSVFGFPNKILIQCGLILVLILCITFTILLKYSAYPNRIGPSMAKILILGFFFPPLLLISLPILYHNSVNKLKIHLE